MSVGLSPNSTIGIVGGGQLGRMSALAAARLGYRCHVLTPEPDSPAAQVAAGTHPRRLRGPRGPARLRRPRSDVITFEFENVTAEGLDLLASLKPVRPSPAVLRISQYRLAEKRFLNGIGVPTAPWRPVQTFAELERAGGAPRPAGGAEDGAARLRRQGPGAAAHARRPRRRLRRGWRPGRCAGGVRRLRLRDQRGGGARRGRRAGGLRRGRERASRPHPGHHLCPGADPRRDRGRGAAHWPGAWRTALDLVGLLAVEMFVTRDGRVLANEIAPRPHNSGHWTIDACTTSQFEMHVRAVAGLPLPPAGRHSDAVMKNLVGPDEIGLWPADPGRTRADPTPLRQARGAAGPQDGPRDPAVPARRHCPGEFGIAAALGPLAPASG